MVGRAMRKLLDKYRLTVDDEGRRRVHDLYDQNWYLMELFPENTDYRKVEKELQKVGRFIVENTVYVPEVLQEIDISNTSWVDYFPEEMLTEADCYDILNDIDGDD